MKNFIQPGDRLDLVAPAGGVVSGAGYLIGALFVVAQHSAAEGAPFVGVPGGVYSLPKKANDVVTQLAAVYWDAAAKNVTVTAAGNTKIGVATKAADAAAATVAVRLNGVA